MSDMDETRDAIEQLAEEFLERYRRGEHPTIAEYAEAYPAWAGRIRELFPTMLMLEGVKLDSSGTSEYRESLTPWSEEGLERLGDFRILREIGRGGMGVVYEAIQESLDRHVALKVLPASYSSSPRVLRRFHREAQAAARLHHMNIVSVFGVGQHEGRHFYVMEYIEGCSLDRVLAELASTYNHGERSGRSDSAEHRPGYQLTEDLLGAEVARSLLSGKLASGAAAPGASGDRPPRGSAAERGSNGAIPGRSSGSEDGTAPDNATRARRVPSLGAAYWRSVARIGAHAASALSYAHRQGTLHRDIKPGNLMLDERRNVWITDFGLAKFGDQEDITHPGDVVGTLRYMAPEQLEGRTDARSDIYSLGLTLYELLTLRPAFDAASRHALIHQVSQYEPPRPRTMAPGIPRDLETVVLKAMAREPGHRYATAGELAEDLGRFLEDRPIRARRASKLEHAWRWSRRNPAVATLSATALLLLLALITAGSVGYVRRTQALATESRLRAQAEDESRRAEANSQLAAEAFDEVFSKLSGASPSRMVGEANNDLWYSVPVAVSQRDAAVLTSLLEFYDRFAQQNRDSRRWEYETALAFRRVGDIHQLLGRTKAAGDAYRRAAERFTRLYETGADPAKYVVGLAGVHNELGRLAQDRDDFDAAFRETHQALDLLTEGGRVAAAASSARFELARTYQQLGFLELLRRFGPDAPADRDASSVSGGRALTEQALTLLKQLAAEEPANGEYRLLMARCYGHLWGASRFSGGDDRQDNDAEAAIRLLEQLVDDFPNNPQYQMELALTYAITSHVSRDAGEESQKPAAMKRVERGVALSEKLVRSYPDVPNYRAVLAMCRLGLTGHLWELQRYDDAAKEALQAVELGRVLRHDSPAGRTSGILARALHTMARIHDLRNEPAALRPFLEELIALESARLNLNSSPPIVPSTLPDAYALLAKTLDELGEPDQASQAARKAAELKPLVQPRPRPRPMHFGPLGARLGER